MISALVTGTIVGDPVERTTQAGAKKRRSAEGGGDA